MPVTALGFKRHILRIAIAVVFVCGSMSLHAQIDDFYSTAPPPPPTNPIGSADAANAIGTIAPPQQLVESPPKSVLVNRGQARTTPRLRGSQEVARAHAAPAPSIWSDSITTVAATKAEIKAAATKSVIAQTAATGAPGVSHVAQIPAVPTPDFSPFAKEISVPLLPDQNVSPANYAGTYGAVSQPIGTSYGGCDGSCGGGCGLGGGGCFGGQYGGGVYAPPLGAATNAYFDAQIYNGQRDGLVLYHYDFHNGLHQDNAQLNAAGRRKLIRLASNLESLGHPLVIQTVPRRRVLSEARKAHVLGFLQSKLGLPISDTQVVLGDPDELGLRGVEAVVIDRNQLQNTRSFGLLGSGGQQSGGGGGGSSFGSSQSQSR